MSRPKTPRPQVLKSSRPQVLKTPKTYYGVGSGGIFSFGSRGNI